MIDLVFHIRKGNKILRKIDARLPEKFSDLTADDLFFICSNVEEKYTIPEIKLLLLQKYAQLKPGELKLLMANPHLVAEIFVRMDINLNGPACDKNLIPFIYYNGMQYNGPFGDFSNVMFEQFGLAEVLFNSYLKSKELVYLQMLAEVLYLPGDYVFSATRVNKDKPVFDQLSREKCLAISVVYSAMRRALFANYKVIYPQVEKQETIEDDEEREHELVSNDFDPLMYENLTEQLARVGQFGHDQETRKAITPNVLFHLNKIAQEDDRK